LDGSGRIRYTEFLAATIEAQGAISEERLAEAFDRLDSDDSGFISAENLAEILGQDFPIEEINSIIQEADKTKDNLISYGEFLALWETKNEQARDEQLKLLGCSKSMADFEILSNSGSKVSISESLASSDLEKEASEKRASFIRGKHVGARQVQVVFDDSIVDIPQDKIAQPSDFLTSDYIP
jgi:hypothetical protein